MSKSLKGGEFEREVCKMLSVWWTDGERSDVFWRTAGSGARATVRRKAGQETANSNGDIGALDPIGEPLISNCLFELKRGYNPTTKKKSGEKTNNNWSVQDAMDRLPSSKPSIFEQFWEKVCEEADHLGRSPFLIFQKDRRQKMIAFRRNMSGLLTSFRGSLHSQPYPSMMNVLFFGDQKEIVVIMRFQDFLDWAHSPQQIWGKGRL